MDREIVDFKKSLLLELINDCKKNNVKTFFYNNAILKKRKIYAGDFRITVYINLDDDHNGRIELNNTKWMYKNVAGEEMIQQF